jgi:hypothetical protein
VGAAGQQQKKNHQSGLHVSLKNAVARAFANESRE